MTTDKWTPCRPIAAAALLRRKQKKITREEGCMRRPSALLLCATVLGLQNPSIAPAQNYPTKPVRVIATSSAGGISDIFIRIVGEELHKTWGQPLVVENRAGGQFNIGARACADAVPDGYTICIMPTDVLQYNRFVFKNLNYDLFKDLEPVSVLFYITQALVVSSSLNVSTLDELAGYAKSHPKTLSYTAAAVPHQLFMENFNRESGADIVRVPFRGGGEAVNGLLTGSTQVAFFGVGNFISHLQAGTIKGLAVDAEKRSPLFPNIATLKELRPNAELTRADFSLWAPKGTPKDIVIKIRNDIAKIGSDPAFVQRHLVERGLDPVFGTPDEFARYLVAQREQVERTAKKAGLQPQ
jgi:tripartite-type tricarboxylate transporter receptor subunit TctC